MGKYIKKDCDKTTIFINGKEYVGESVCYRIDKASVPKGKVAYDIRHSDNDGSQVASIAKLVIVNHWGTFISDPIEELENGKELAIEDWGID